MSLWSASPGWTQRPAGGSEDHRTRVRALEGHVTDLSPDPGQRIAAVMTRAGLADSTISLPPPLEERDQ